MFVTPIGKVLVFDTLSLPGLAPLHITKCPLNPTPTLRGVERPSAAWGMGAWGEVKE